MGYRAMCKIYLFRSRLPTTCDDAQGRTNSIAELLWHVAGKAPGHFARKHTRLGRSRYVHAPALAPRQTRSQHRARSQHHRCGGNQTQGPTTFSRAGESWCIHRGQCRPMVGGGTTQEREEGRESRTQVKKQQKKQDVLARKRKLMDKGISVGAKKSGPNAKVVARERSSAAAQEFHIRLR